MMYHKFICLTGSNLSKETNLLFELSTSGGVNLSCKAPVLVIVKRNMMINELMRQYIITKEPIIVLS